MEGDVEIYDPDFIPGLCKGRPTDREILYWKHNDHVWNSDLVIRKECPHCGSTRTRWVRNEWNICLTCLIPFTQTEYEDYQGFLEEQYG
jgi:hypothetical protein